MGKRRIKEPKSEIAKLELVMPLERTFGKNGRKIIFGIEE